MTEPLSHSTHAIQNKDNSPQYPSSSPSHSPTHQPTSPKLLQSQHLHSIIQHHLPSHPQNLTKPPQNPPQQIHYQKQEQYQNGPSSILKYSEQQSEIQDESQSRGVKFQEDQLEEKMGDGGEDMGGVGRFGDDGVKRQDRRGQGGNGEDGDEQGRWDFSGSDEDERHYSSGYRPNIYNEAHEDYRNNQNYPINHSTYTSNSIHNPNLNLNHIPIPKSSKNTDGRQIPQKSRRALVQNLLQATKNLPPFSPQYKQKIARQAQKIKVFTNEVMIWVSTYRIVFEVEGEMVKRAMGEGDVIAFVEMRLVGYLNQNVGEKRYRFLKICNRVFRALNIRKCTGDFWLRDLLKKHQLKLNPRIDISKLLKNPNSNSNSNSKLTHSYSYSSHQHQHQNSNNFYPQQVRQKLIQKIDKTVQFSILKILQDRSQELGIGFGEMKRWYGRYGRLRLFQGDVGGMHGGGGSFQRPVINLNSPILKQAEQQILKFLKTIKTCSKSTLFTYTCSILKKLNIPQFQSQPNFSNWLNRLLSTTCYFSANNPETIQLRELQHQGREGGHGGQGGQGGYQVSRPASISSRINGNFGGNCKEEEFENWE